jgi:hypothetical protein
MKRLRCTYNELVDQPAIVYQDAVMDINAESASAKTTTRWATR